MYLCMCLVLFPLSSMKRNYKKEDTTHVQLYDYILDFTPRVIHYNIDAYYYPIFYL